MGEFQLIDKLIAGLPQGPEVLLGPGDDAAVLQLNGSVVLTTDVLIEDVHFKRSWSQAEHIGRKAVAVNISDLEAMGADPKAVVIGLAVPKETSNSWLLEFNAGVRAECEKAGASLVGGDLSGAAQIAVSVAAVGDLGERSPVRRDGAQVSDTVAVCGRLGLAAAGLAALQRGFSSPREVVAEQRCPTVPYGQGKVAAVAGASAMLDISDGLLADLGHICERSGVGIDLDPTAFEVSEAIERVCAATGKEPLAFILAGGEDHALVACFPSGTSLPAGWLEVGKVVAGSEVLVAGQQWEGSAGWDHFAG